LTAYTTTKKECEFSQKECEFRHTVETYKEKTTWDAQNELVKDKLVKY